ncbi:protein DPCD [Manduca sexta]|uniref:Protein DPCD n=1 Tax=Manduca sexta TaxID=7130 RepID=A0A921YVC4_MANSE|nr:protein DPCD [Manduca sexta]KAG6446036.1 hypothetical protein O3G_MSEX004209 [Manduca sexta]
MKRKSCLIETIDNFVVTEKNVRKNSVANLKMHRNTIWYHTLLGAEKSCLKEEKIKKIHYKFEDNREMVEEYNVDTQVLLRRAWKVKGKLGGEGKWEVEIGDPLPDMMVNTDSAEIIESKDQPIVSRRNTRINLEWRIRNLPYPIGTYSVEANSDEKCIIVRTTNKKYYKKLQIPELVRLNLPVEQANIQFTHSFHTLIITYKKPQQLLDMDKDWNEELKKVKPVKDIPNECKTQ